MLPSHLLQLVFSLVEKPQDLRNGTWVRVLLYAGTAKLERRFAVPFLSTTTFSSEKCPAKILDGTSTDSKAMANTCREDLILPYVRSHPDREIGERTPPLTFVS